MLQQAVLDHVTYMFNMTGYKKCAACSTYYGVLQQAVLIRVVQPQQPAAAAQRPPQLIIPAIVIRPLSASLSVPARAPCARGAGPSSPSSRAPRACVPGLPGPRIRARRDPACD